MHNDETDYARLGERATPEARLAAARAALVFTFGADWEGTRTATYLEPACERLDRFAGMAAIRQAGDELDPFNLTEERASELIEPVVAYFKQHFPVRSTPPNNKYWLEVIRQARVNRFEVNQGRGGPQW